MRRRRAQPVRSARPYDQSKRGRQRPRSAHSRAFERQPRIRRPTVTNCHVEAFVYKVRYPVGKDHIKLDLGIAQGEVIERRGELDHAERKWLCQTKPSSQRLRRNAVREVEMIVFVEQRTKSLEICLTCLGCRNRACRAIQQSHAEFCLQSGDKLGRLTRTCADVIGTAGETARFIGRMAARDPLRNQEYASAHATTLQHSMRPGRLGQRHGRIPRWGCSRP